MRKTNFIQLALASLFLINCSSQEVPAAHKGRLFDKTGMLAFYAGGKGFEGPILGPGTYFTGVYPELRLVECTQQTTKEPLEALTSDSVQFNLDIYVRFSANCDDTKAIEKLLETLLPTKFVKDNKDVETAVVADSITTEQLYRSYVRPVLGEAVRKSVSQYIANDINTKRDEIFVKIKNMFSEFINKENPKFIVIQDINLSNLDFPKELTEANTQRAAQAILKDKAIAEREKVTAEIETAKIRKQLIDTEAANDTSKIDAIGAALHRNPEYLQYDMQQRMNEIYYHAGEKGNLIISAPGIQMPVIVSPKTK